MDFSIQKHTFWYQKISEKILKKFYLHEILLKK